MSGEIPFVPLAAEERMTKSIITFGKYMPSGTVECLSSTCVVSPDVARASGAHAIVYNAAW
eukprot:CAMPEP_0168442016 /NCGR_PEP_ID=MMETSP0228-20121227/43790_1 /TAXON_ID=133427 /ORGANISM="Protoceratium reticulatum, Strain CCCM 535 (=CCMP 1889)" /LENGTH=60 /DNA_ID=CAMNT_0008456363 /DNA_START=45 /DNA_END=224 /DNA_ORIENTATION=+